MMSQKVLVPKTLPEFKKILTDYGSQCTLLAGGTDLLVEMRKQQRPVETIVDLSYLDSLRGITQDKDWISIGAMTTFSELAGSRLIYENGKCLWEAAGRIGSTQIRNMATIGGNIANAAPAADGVCALLALKAELLVTDGITERWVSLEQYLDSRIACPANQPEAILTIRFSKAEEGQYSAFAKLGKRSSVTISQLILACTLTMDRNHVIQNAVVVLGAIGMRGFYDQSTSHWLVGKRCSTSLKTELWDQLAQSIEAAIPGRASMPYKRISVMGLVDDVLRDLMMPNDSAPFLAKAQSR